MKNQRPVFSEIVGSIEVAVWANESDGQVFFTTKITRRYKVGETWHKSNTFTGLGDLALAGKGIQLAEDFIRRQQAKHENTSADEQSSNDP